MTTPHRIAVIGLGYVGLPLAIALARHFNVVGVDIDQRRIAELKAGEDRTREIERDQLRASTLQFTAEPNEARGRDIYIVTVPTPVDANNAPDLTAVRSASGMVGKV